MTRLVDITVQLLHETDRAVLVTDTTPARACWLAKSLIEIRPTDDGKAHEVTLPEWLAIERGLV